MKMYHVTILLRIRTSKKWLTNVVYANGHRHALMLAIKNLCVDESTIRQVEIRELVD